MASQEEVNADVSDYEQPSEQKKGRFSCDNLDSTPSDNESLVDEESSNSSCDRHDLTMSEQEEPAPVESSKEDIESPAAGDNAKPIELEVKRSEDKHPDTSSIKPMPSVSCTKGAIISERLRIISSKPEHENYKPSKYACYQE